MDENPLQKYIGREYHIIDKVQVKQGTTKDGAPYCYLDLHFVNGFNKRFYPNDAERFAIISAFEYEMTSKQIDKEF